MSIALERINSRLAWTPEALREEVENEKALRAVMIDYFKSQLKVGHHYYDLTEQDGRKPALAKEGALNLCSLFKVVPEPDAPIETFGPDEHYTVRFRYRLRSLRTDGIVAIGDGSCTTREDKYAYRWLWPNQVPVSLNKDTLLQRPVRTKSGNTVKYRVPNNDLPSTYNTVLKMASKRALVDASLKLPLVSELFTQDLEEDQVRKELFARLSAAREKSGFTKEQLRERSVELFGKANSDDLTDDEITKLIDELGDAASPPEVQSRADGSGPAASPEKVPA